MQRCVYLGTESFSNVHRNTDSVRLQEEELGARTGVGEATYSKSLLGLDP